MYLETLEAYQVDPYKAYEIFCTDDTAAPLTFDEFCNAFDKLTKRHQENVKAERAHAEVVGKIS